MLKRVQEKSDLPDSIDNQGQLAGSNCMEVLLFSLGTTEHFGINVYKVREVSNADRSFQYCPPCQTGGKILADRRMSRLLK